MNRPSNEQLVQPSPLYIIKSLPAAPAPALTTTLLFKWLSDSKESLCAAASLEQG